MFLPGSGVLATRPTSAAVHLQQAFWALPKDSAKSGNKGFYIFWSLNPIMSLLWDHHDIIHFAFLKQNQTFNADLYTQQLQCKYENLQRKHPTFIIRRNVVLTYNARLHSARIMLEKIYLFYPPSPDIAASDFHLFFPYKILWMTKTFLKKIRWKCFFLQMIKNLLIN